VDREADRRDKVYAALAAELDAATIEHLIADGMKMDEKVSVCSRLERTHRVR